LAGWLVLALCVLWCRPAAVLLAEIFIKAPSVGKANNDAPAVYYYPRCYHAARNPWTRTIIALYYTRSFSQTNAAFVASYRNEIVRTDERQE
jgi:hypothetical protein